MPATNIDDLFSVYSLTDSINQLPSLPGKAAALGLFVPKGIPTTAALIDVKQGRLVLIPNQSRDSEGVNVAGPGRGGILVECAHLPATGVVLPSEIQNVRGFGQEATEAGLESQAQVINDRLEIMKNSLDATLEYHLVGALRGKVLDPTQGDPVLFDWFEKFGVEKRSIDVQLSAVGTDVRKSCFDAKRAGEEHVAGAMVTGWMAYCGKGWFDSFVGHKNVKDVYANYQESADRNGGDVRGGFTFGGITFVEYNAEVSGKKFIPDDVAQVFPIGRGLASLYYAPANYNEAVNTIGKPYYAKSEPRKMGKGWDLEAQKNPLAVFHFPGALTELRAV